MRSDTAPLIYIYSYGKIKFWITWGLQECITRVKYDRNSFKYFLTYMRHNFLTFVAEVDENETNKLTRNI